MKKIALLAIVAVALFFAGCKKKDPAPSSPPSTPTGGSGGTISMSTLCYVTATIGSSSASWTENGNPIEVVFGSSKSINPPNPTTAIYDFGLYK